MLDKRLKDLNNLPEDARLKQKILTQLQVPKRKHPSLFKEIALISFIACIAFFLSVVPQLEQNTTTSGGMTIYTAFGGEPSKFFARSSTLYTGVHHEKNEQLLHFFHSFDQYMTESEGRLGEHIVDVVIVEHGQETRYQMSDSYLLNVDTGVFYSGDRVYEDAFNIAYSPHNGSSWYIWIPFLTILVNLYATHIYKRAKIKFEIPAKYRVPPIVGFLAILFGTMFYSMQIGPIFKPLLLLFPIVFGFVMWRIVKKVAPSPVVYRTELIRFGVTAVMIAFFLLSL